MNYLKTLTELYKLKRNVKLSKEEMRSLQNRKLRKLLRFAWEHSSYYRMTFENAGITEEQLDELEEVILLSEFHMKKVSGNNADQVTDLDGKFHKILYEASDSRILSHVLMDFHKYVQQARRNSVVSEERARKSIREHKQILRAIRDNDADLAEQLANEHILHVMQNLKKQGYEEI